MKREELIELHYITPISNVRSILRSGILSHRGAERVAHESVALDEIQDRRRRVMVPNGQPLHNYVNLYVCARNPMMYRRHDEHQSLCVLSVNPKVLDLPGVVVTDRNASSNYVRFAAAPGGLSIVDRDLVFAEHWTHPDDQVVEWLHKSVKCAEVLVPNRVSPQYVHGAYVSCPASQVTLRQIAPSLTVAIDDHLFFR